MMLFKCPAGGADNLFRLAKPGNFMRFNLGLLKKGA